MLPTGFMYVLSACKSIEQGKEESGNRIQQRAQSFQADSPENGLNCAKILAQRFYSGVKIHEVELTADYFIKLKHK